MDIRIGNCSFSYSILGGVVRPVRLIRLSPTHCETRGHQPRTAGQVGSQGHGVIGWPGSPRAVPMYRTSRLASLCGHVMVTWCCKSASSTSRANGTTCSTEPENSKWRQGKWLACLCLGPFSTIFLCFLRAYMCHGEKSRSKILKVPHQVYNSESWVPKVPRQVYISGSWVPKVP